MDIYPVLISWGFNTRSGKLELDVFHDLTTENAAEAVGPIYLRANMHHYNVSLLKIPIGLGRTEVQKYIEHEDRTKVLETLNKAKVRKEDIVRAKNSDVNSIDYLLSIK